MAAIKPTARPSVKITGECSGISRELYEFIKHYILEHGYAPTYKEMADGMEKSTSTIFFHMDKLISSGLVETDDPGSPRAIRIPDIRMSEKAPKGRR